VEGYFGIWIVEGELAWWTGKDCLYIELFDNFEFQFILENGVFVMQEDGIFGMMNLNKFSQSIMSGYDFKW